MTTEICIFGVSDLRLNIGWVLLWCLLEYEVAIFIKSLLFYVNLKRSFSKVLYAKRNGFGFWSGAALILLLLKVLFEIIITVDIYGIFFVSLVSFVLFCLFLKNKPFFSVSYNAFGSFAVFVICVIWLYV
jgi:hypothetical protein